MKLQLNKSLFTILAFLNLICVSPPLKATGTVGGGGGSYYKGKPIESYHGDPRQTKTYKEHIEPLLVKLKSFKSVPLDLLFDYVLDKKIWYYVPGPLKQLPQGKTGTFISDTQGILQNFKAVWVDIDIFNNRELLLQALSRYNEQTRKLFQEVTKHRKELTLSELQAMIVIHELLMGVKILKFESDQTICKTLTSMPESCLGLSDKRPFGRKSLEKLLKQEDYDEIRYTTIKLFYEYSSMNEEDVKTMMANNNFSNDIYQFVPSSAFQKITYKDLLTAVQAGVLTNGLPKYEYKEEKHQELFMDAFKQQSRKTKKVLWESSGPCNMQFSNFNDRGFTVNFNKDGQSYGPYNLTHPGGEYSAQPPRENWTSMKSYEMSLSNYQSKPFSRERAPQLGDSYHDVTFNLLMGPPSSMLISAIYISELVCISLDPLVWREKEGSQYQCSDLKAIPLSIKPF